jgi:hypothetical protein
LKQRPEDVYFKSIEAEEVLIGIRADEPNRVHDKCYPLVEAGLSKDDVKKLCQKHGLLNPVYEWRSSVSCFCCFFQKARDWRGLMIHHPTLYEIANEWEKQCISTSKTATAYTWKQGHTLEAMRKWNDEQLSLWPEPEEEPCLICRI